MKKLFLTSSANTVMKDIVKQFDKPEKGLKVAFIGILHHRQKKVIYLG